MAKAISPKWNMNKFMFDEIDNIGCSRVGCLWDPRAKSTRSFITQRAVTVISHHPERKNLVVMNTSVSCDTYGEEWEERRRKKVKLFCCCRCCEWERPFSSLVFTSTPLYTHQPCSESLKVSDERSSLLLRHERDVIESYLSWLMKILSFLVPYMSLGRWWESAEKRRESEEKEEKLVKIRRSDALWIFNEAIEQSQNIANSDWKKKVVQMCSRLLWLRSVSREWKKDRGSALL